MNKHFYYSQRQADLLKRLGNKVIMYVTINGNKVRYTRSAPAKIDKWKDDVYLGETDERDIGFEIISKDAPSIVYKDQFLVCDPSVENESEDPMNWANDFINKARKR